MIHHFVYALPIPILAAGLGALGSIGGAAAGLLNKPKTPTPVVPPTPAPAQMAQGSTTTGAPTATPSFLAAAATPQGQNVGGKSLLGQ